MDFRTFIESAVNANGMRIKIIDNPVVTGGSMEADGYRKELQKVAGQWLPVETKHLFGDQFNTEKLRVHIRDVHDIDNDVRPMAAKCGWCGACFLNVKDEHIGEPCPACQVHPMHENAVIDRIRPLITVKDGKTEIINYAPRYRTIKTPEGDIRHQIPWKRPVG